MLNIDVEVVEIKATACIHKISKPFKQLPIKGIFS